MSSPINSGPGGRGGGGHKVKVLPKGGRELGKMPCQGDLEAARFSTGSSFKPGQIVIVPRSRGGFVYGQIKGSKTRDQCLVNGYQHRCVEWRVQYPSLSGNMYKNLSASMIGRVPRGTPLRSPHIAEDKESLRVVGAPPLFNDLLNVVFSPKSKFREGEICLVPRSSGGFSYGEVACERSLRCPFDIDDTDGSAHSIKGYQVFVTCEGEDGDRKRKGLFGANLGKLLHQVRTEECPPRTAVWQALDVKTLEKETKVHAKKPQPKKREQRRYRSKHRAGKDAPCRRARNSGPGSSNGDDANEGRNGEPQESEDSSEVCEREGEEGFDDVNCEIEGEVVCYRGINAMEDVKETMNGESESTETGNCNESVDTSAEVGASAQELDFMPADCNDFQSSNIALSTGNEAALQHGQPQQGTSQAQRGGGLLRVELPQSEKPPKKKKGRLVVIDAPNVAMKYGKHIYSAKGIKICMDYFQDRGFEVIGFLPEHYVRSKPSTTGTVSLKEYMPSKIDDLDLVKQMVEDELIVLTPPQDYDDSYCIEYARTNNGYIVSNDRYWDHVDKQPEKARGKTIRWLRDHCVSFTFVKDNFLPNPDFKLRP